MATYPKLASTLAALQPTATDPQATEDAGKLVDAIRQTRNWVYDFCSRFFDDATGTLKPAAFSAQGGSLPAGYIRGSDLSVTPPVEREIAKQSITGYDIALGAISDAHFADNVIYGKKLVPGSITNEKFAPGTITPAKLAGDLSADMLGEGAIQPVNIVDEAVTSAKLADDSVGTDHIVARAVDGTKLPEAEAGTILVGGQTINGEENCLAPKKLSGVLTINSNGVVTVSAGISSTYARVSEVVPSGVAGGLTNTSWTYRGQKIPWKQQSDKADLVDISNEVIGLKKNGTYLIMARAPGYRVNGHRIRLEMYPDGNDPTAQRIYLGSCEYSNQAAAYGMTYSELSALVTVVNATDTNIPYFRIAHFFENLTFANDNMMGRPVSSGAFEIYAEVSLFKIT